MKNIVFLFLLFTTKVSAQFQHPLFPYQQVQYDGLHPLWYETTYDVTMVSDSCDGYNHIAYTFQVEEFFYDSLAFVPNYYKNPYGMQGSYIECRSMRTGAVKWSHRYPEELFDHVEFVKLFYVDDEEHLVVFSQKERVPFEKNVNKPYFKNMILTKRVYDIHSGSLISYTHLNYDDPTAFITSTSYWPGNWSSKLFREHEHLRYVESYNIRGVQKLKSCLLNDSGQLVSNVDSLTIPYYKLNFNLVQIHPDTLLEIEIDRAERILYFRYLKPNLEPYYEAASEPLDFDITYIELKQTSSDKQKFLFTCRFASDDITLDNFAVLSFDRDARLIKSGLLVKNKEFFDVLDWEMDSQSFVMLERTYVNDGDSLKSKLEIYKLGPQDKREALKDVTSATNLRFAAPDFCKTIGNDKYYVKFWETAFKPSNSILFHDQHASAYSHMLLDAGDLGIVTDTKDEKPDICSDHIRLYPNPVKDVCSITLGFPFSGTLFISDLHGRTVYTKQIENASELQLTNLNFPSGLYFVQFNSDNKELVSLKTKFMKM